MEEVLEGGVANKEREGMRGGEEGTSEPRVSCGARSSNVVGSTLLWKLQKAESDSVGAAAPMVCLR